MKFSSTRCCPDFTEYFRTRITINKKTGGIKNSSYKLLEVMLSRVAQIYQEKKSLNGINQLIESESDSLRAMQTNRQEKEEIKQRNHYTAHSKFEKTPSDTQNNHKNQAANFVLKNYLRMGVSGSKSAESKLESNASVSSQQSLEMFENEELERAHNNQRRKSSRIEKLKSRKLPVQQRLNSIDEPIFTVSEDTRRGSQETGSDHQMNHIEKLKRRKLPKEPNAK